jgi:ATP synthase F0 subunit b
MPAMCAATGAPEYGIYQFDTYTGLNWSTVPCILVECGFMSNPDEDVLLNTPEYQQKLAAAQATSERLVKEAVSRGQSREEEIIRQANAEADAIRAKAAADIAQEKKKAINDAKDEISDLALAIAEKVVGRELNAADQSDLVDAFINGLGENV